MDWSSIVVAIITGSLALIGVVVTNQKTKTLLEYRMKELEKKVDEQNKLKEEVADIKKAIALLSKDIEILKTR